MSVEVGMTIPTFEMGRQLQINSRFPDATTVVFAGKADHVADGTVWGGARFKLSTAIVEAKTLEWQWIEPVYLVGGRLYTDSGDIDDYLLLEMIAPATAGTSVTAGTGEYEKQTFAGSINKYVPDGTKDWDLNLTEKLNGNVAFTKAVPVRAKLLDGYFDYDIDTGVITKNAAGTGAYNILDADLSFGDHLVEYPTFGTFASVLEVAESPTEKFLPHWKMKATWNSATAVAKNITWSFTLARGTTT